MTKGYTDMAGVSHGWIWRADHIKYSSLTVLLSVGRVPPQTDKAARWVKELFQWGSVEDTFNIDTQELRQKDFEFWASLAYQARFQNASSQATSS